MSLKMPLSSVIPSDVKKAIKKTRISYIDKMLFGYRNVNSKRSKFDILRTSQIIHRHSYVV